MPRKYARVLTCTVLLAGLCLPACNDDDTQGEGGGQVSGDTKAVGEDVREQIPVPGGKNPEPAASPTPGTTAAGSGSGGGSGSSTEAGGSDRSNTRTGSESTGGIDAGSNQGNRQQDR